jgi:hypothetical protein
VIHEYVTYESENTLLGCDIGMIPMCVGVCYLFIYLFIYFKNSFQISKVAPQATNSEVRKPIPSLGMYNVDDTTHLHP